MELISRLSNLAACFFGKWEVFCLLKIGLIPGMNFFHFPEEYLYITDTSEHNFQESFPGLQLWIHC